MTPNVAAICVAVGTGVLWLSVVGLGIWFMERGWAEQARSLRRGKPTP